MLKLTFFSSNSTLAAVALALAGCAAQPTASVDECLGFGWEPGTDGYAQCRQALEIQARDARAAEQAVLSIEANRAARAWALSLGRRR